MSKATQTYITPIPPSSPVVIYPKYPIDPNIFSHLKSGMHLMGSSVDIKDMSLFKYVDTIYIYNKQENKYIIKDTHKDKDINIQAHSGFYIHNQTGDNYDIVFNLSAPNCKNDFLTPPIPPAPSLEEKDDDLIPISLVETNAQEQSRTLSARLLTTSSTPLPKCTTLLSKIDDLEAGWHLLGTSKEIINSEGLLENAKYIFVLSSEEIANEFVDIRKVNKPIKANSGFWLYK